jgi:hypothetical protein
VAFVALSLACLHQNRFTINPQSPVNLQQVSDSTWSCIFMMQTRHCQIPYVVVVEHVPRVLMCDEPHAMLLNIQY